MTPETEPPFYWPCHPARPQDFSSGRAGGRPLRTSERLFALIYGLDKDNFSHEME